jgi:hypothetical protein
MNFELTLARSSAMLPMVSVVDCFSSTLAICLTLAITARVPISLLKD